MKKIFALAFFLLFTFSANAALLDNIVGFWKLDETSGNALDANGNYHGTVTGTTRGITGKFGNAYNFDGTLNNNIDLGSNANILMGTSDYSISVWIKTNAGVTLSTSDNLYTIISNQSTGSALGYTLFLRGGTYNGILFRIGNGSSYYDLKPTANVSTTVIDGNWHHIVVAVDRDGTSNLYLDGSSVGNTSFSSITGTNITYSANMKIGLHSESGGSLPFNGKLDDIGLWKRTLTSTDVSSLYANTPSFSTTTYTLSTSISPTAGGSITLSPAGGTYTSGTSVTATANTNSGYAFSGWSGAATGTTNPVSITMDVNKSLTATFTTATTYSLTITNPTNGTITASPAGPNYASGTTVTLTANPSSGYQLSAWGESLSGTTNPAMLTMNANKTVSATFVPVSAGSDNLGNHTATQNFKLGSFWLSSDGGSEGLRVDANGNVGIGIAPLTSTLLTVNGKILAKEVEVVSSITSDYVFEPEYILMPLTELEIYVRKNKHLPNIPSAITFAKEGQNLAKMDDMLLRKVEELTLYILEQNKKIEAMQSEIELLKNSKSN